MIDLRRDSRRLSVAAFSLLIAAAVFFAGYFSALPSKERESKSEIFGMPVTEKFIPEGGGRPGIRRKIKYIVVHETSNHTAGANAAAHSEYLLAGGDGSTSWHYTVDEIGIYRHIPDSEVAWHAGDKLKSPGGNLNGVAIELCVNDDGDFEKTFQNGAKLTAFLLEAYDLELEDVKQHWDFSGKNCPMTIRDAERWQEFIAAVAEYSKKL